MTDKKHSHILKKTLYLMLCKQFLLSNKSEIDMSYTSINFKINYIQLIVLENIKAQLSFRPTI